MMHSHNETDQMVRNILTRIASEDKKPFKKVKNLFAFKGHRHITHRFWEILREMQPNHEYIDVFHCPECDSFELE